MAELRAALPDDVVLIEDGAHAIGGRRADGPVGDGAHADMTIQSFHPVKTVTTGEGGAITLRDPELRQKLLDFRSHGMTKDPARLERPDEGGWYMEQQALGFNYRITDLQCALGSSQLRKLERFVAAPQRDRGALPRRRWPASRSSCRRPAPAGALHAYHLFVVRVATGAALYDGAARARDLRPGPLPARLPAPVVPRDLRLRSRDCAPQAEAYYDGLPLAAVLPGAHRGRAGHGDRGGPRARA